MKLPSYPNIRIFGNSNGALIYIHRCEYLRVNSFRRRYRAPSSFPLNLFTKRDLRQCVNLCVAVRRESEARALFDVTCLGVEK